MRGSQRTKCKENGDTQKDQPRMVGKDWKFDDNCCSNIREKQKVGRVQWAAANRASELAITIIEKRKSTEWNSTNKAVMLNSTGWHQKEEQRTCGKLSWLLDVLGFWKGNEREIKRIYWEWRAYLLRTQELYSVTYEAERIGNQEWSLEEWSYHKFWIFPAWKDQG